LAARAGRRCRAGRGPQGGAAGHRCGVAGPPVAWL